MQLAKFVGDIAVGEVQETPQAPDTPATESRRKGGLRGGRARAKKLSARKRREIAKRDSSGPVEEKARTTTTYTTENCRLGPSSVVR